VSDPATGNPTEFQKAATIYDVAERAKVSIKTVSKVINNLPEVSLATRSRVQAAIEEMSYRPNQTRSRPRLTSARSCSA